MYHSVDTLGWMALRNKAILGYLKSSGYDGAFESLAVESGISEEEATDERYSKLLEKKWTAIIRLQKKAFCSLSSCILLVPVYFPPSLLLTQILQLEAQVSSLQEDLVAYGKGKKTDKSETLPREPAKHSLHGHRMPITKVSVLLPWSCVSVCACVCMFVCVRVRMHACCAWLFFCFDAQWFV